MKIIIKSKNRKIMFIMGPIISHNIDLPVNNPKSITPNKTLGPYVSRFCDNLGLYLLIKLPNICPPSRG